jgi:dienelactone hydrolase
MFLRVAWKSRCSPFRSCFDIVYAIWQSTGVKQLQRPDSYSLPSGKEVAVDFYLPQGLKKAPVVVVAHGFSRSRLNMAGWGGLLASNGFITAIPDLPAWSDHERNSQAIRELLDRINSKTLVTEPAPNGDGALMGFSMGGLCTLLAAATND